MITVTALMPRHSKDNELLVITALYLTEDKQLMLSGHCSKCLKDVSLLIRLGELYDQCPDSSKFTETEASRLHALGILPDPPLLPPT